MKSLCDSCYQPGYCCKGFRLSEKDGTPITFWFDKGDDGINEQLRERGLPFVLDYRGEAFTDPESGRPYGEIGCKCPLLGRDGRCMDYENRPQLCRDYQPRTDSLCCHYHGEGIDLVDGL